MRDDLDKVSGGEPRRGGPPTVRTALDPPAAIPDVAPYVHHANGLDGAHALADVMPVVSAEEPRQAEAEEVEPQAAAAPDTFPADSTVRSRRAAVWLANIRWLVGVVFIVFFIRTFIGEATIIPTGSMEQTIMVGDHVFLNKLLYGPHIPFTNWKVPSLRRVHRQDIVAFRYPRDPAMVYVKRVVGLPGDRLEIRRNRVFVNGRALDEPYVTHTSPNLRENFGPVNVPEGHLFVMGDNRDNSSDSRYWGTVPERNVVGVPLIVYWSYEAPSEQWLREGAMNRARFWGSVVLNFFSKTRWSRTGLVF